MYSSGSLPGGAASQEGAGLGHGAALPPPQLPGRPLDQQRVAVGQLVERLPLGCGGVRQLAVVLGQLVQQRQRVGQRQAIQPDGARVHVAAPPAGDDGLVALRQAAQELEDPHALGLGQGLQVVDDEQGALAGQRAAHRVGALGWVALAMSASPSSRASSASSAM